MANRWLVQNLVDKVKRRGLVVFSDDASEGTAVSDVLSLIDDVSRSFLVPLLKKTRESYLTASTDMDLTAGLARYSLPSRAAAETLRAILYDAGNDAWPPLNRIELEEAYANGNTTGQPSAFYLDDDAAVFVPTPGSATTVRFVYFRRPSYPVEASEVAYVDSIDTGSKTVTLLSYTTDTEEFDDSSIPSTFTTSATYDFVKGKPGFRCRGVDLVATGTTTDTVTFEEDLPDGLEVGDFLCLAGETPIAQVPLELQPLLAQEVARQLLEARGDSKADRAGKTVEKMTEDAVAMLTPRTSETPRYILNPNIRRRGSKRRRFL